MTDTRGSILQPLLAYRFRVLFDHEIIPHHLIDENRLLLTQQVYETTLDLLHNIFTVKLRQPVTSELFKQIIWMTEDPNTTQTIVIEPTDGKEATALWSLHLLNCRCTSHECNFGYSNNNTLFHNMAFKYKTAKITEPVDWDHLRGRDSIPPKDGAISPEEAVQKIEEASEE